MWNKSPKMDIYQIHFNRIFPYKPSSYWGTPICGTPHIYIYIHIYIYTKSCFITMFPSPKTYLPSRLKPRPRHRGFASQRRQRRRSARAKAKHLRRLVANFLLHQSRQYRVYKVYVWMYLFIHLTICLFIYLMYLFIYIITFARLSASAIPLIAIPLVERVTGGQDGQGCSHHPRYLGALGGKFHQR